MFWGCGKDVESELKLSEGLEIIGLSSFCDTSIKEVDIPSTVKEIKLAAFNDHVAFSQVDIGCSVKFGRF